MTKFESEAIGVRSGRKKNFVSGKERRKEMEKFQRTGRHPDLDPGAASQTMRALPERDPNRPHVFFDLKSRDTTYDRLVVEVFEDAAPLAARQFMNRCRAGAAYCFQGTAIHRVLQDHALFGGTPKGYAGPGVRAYAHLQHTDAGVVSLALSGDEFLITLSRALTLDATHQVVGRVCRGGEVLAQLNELRTDADDAPLFRLSVARCGLTDAQGTHETLDGRTARKEAPEETAARLKKESALAAAAVEAAVANSLATKRKAEPEAKSPAAKRSVMASMLEGLNSDSDSGEE